MLALEIVFWLCAALIVWTQLGYALALAPSLARRRAARAARRARSGAPQGRSPEDRRSAAVVSLIVAAHDEQAGDRREGRKRARARLPARAAGGDRRLRRLHRRDRRARARRPAPTSCSSCRAAARSARRTPPSQRAARRDRRLLRRQRAVGARRAARARAARSPTRASATPAGRSASCRPPVGARRANQEGVYWRYELAVRALESRLSSITAGNGAIYATRRDSYIVVDPIMGHDLSLPFNMVKRGLRAVYVPSARASEKMVPSLRGRVRAQAADDEPHLADRPARRHALAARLPARLRADDLLPPRAALRRRPLLHVLALAANIALVARRRRRARTRSRSRCSSRCCSPPRSPARCARARC